MQLSPPALRPESEILSTWRSRCPVVVSVWCTSYNNVDYIEDALHGFLGQTTTFPFEIIIRDDASTDGSSAIIRDYAARYPTIIQAILETENQWLKQDWFEVMMASSRGEFIALCDGDDYWISEHKLERQTRILRGDPGLTMAVHSAHVIHGRGSDVNSNRFPSPTRTRMRFEDVLQFHCIHTGSVFFRASALPTVPGWIKKVVSPDIAVELMLASKGDCHYDFEKASVYRAHLGGVTSSVTYTPEEYRQFARVLYDGIDDFTGGVHGKKLDRHRALLDLVCAVGLMRGFQTVRATRYLMRALRRYPAVICFAIWRQVERRRRELALSDTSAL